MRGLLRTMDWIGLAAGTAGLVTIGAVALRTASNRSLAESGALFIVLGVGRALPLAGMGFGLGFLRGREAALTGILFLLGLFLGWHGKEWLLTMVVTGPGTANRLFLVDPAACVAGGLALAPPERIRRWLLPALGLGVGTLVAFSTKLNDTSPGDPGFPFGAAPAAIWLFLLAALIAQRARQRWPRALAVLARIFGSWLLAIGVLLGGAALIQRPVMDVAPPLPLPQNPWPSQEDQQKLHPKLPGLGEQSPP